MLTLLLFVAPFVVATTMLYFSARALWTGKLTALGYQVSRGDNTACYWTAMAGCLALAAAAAFVAHKFNANGTSCPVLADNCDYSVIPKRAS